jgi:hypothetical protein
MKILVVMLVLAVVLGVAPAASTAENDFTGKWTCVADSAQRPITIAIDLKQDGENLSGTTSSDIGNGTIEGGKVTGSAFTATLKTELMGQAFEFKMDGKLEGDKITGSFTNGQLGTIPYSANRNK